MQMQMQKEIHLTVQFTYKCSIGLYKRGIRSIKDEDIFMKLVQKVFHFSIWKGVSHPKSYFYPITPLSPKEKSYVKMYVDKY